MNADQLNLLVLAGVVVVAAALAVGVSALFSRTLREQGPRKLLKRWLSR